MIELPLQHREFDSRSANHFAEKKINRDRGESPHEPSKNYLLIVLHHRRRIVVVITFPSSWRSVMVIFKNHLHRQRIVVVMFKNPLIAAISRDDFQKFLLTCGNLLW